jgi:hypothetical protein
MNLRNTRNRYRFNSLMQRWNVYSTYWNRTLRSIENGTYFRNVARAGRDAIRKGVDIPDEVLRALPPLQREKLLAQRDKLRAKAVAEGKLPASGEPAAVGSRPGVVQISEDEAAENEKIFSSDGDFDATFDNLFGSLGEDAAKATAPVAPPSRPPAPTAPPSRPPAPPVAVSPPTAPSSRPPAPGAPRPPTAPPSRPPPIPAAARAPTAPPSVPPGARPPTAPPSVPPAARPAPGTPAAGAPRPVAPPTRPPTPRPPTKIPPGMDERSMQELYQRFLAAKREVGEDPSNVKYESLLQTVAAQAPKIMAQHHAQGVEFQVAVKDNKVILKAQPKK